VRETFAAGVNEKTLVAWNSSPREWNQVREVAGVFVRTGDSAPRKPIDMALPLRGETLLLESFDCRCLRETVQRHVDHSRETTRRGSPCGCDETLPLGAAGFVDVCVGVDKAGKDRSTAEVANLYVTGKIVRSADAKNDSLFHQESRGLDTGGQDYPA
jgi:hypothetical protein